MYFRFYESYLLFISQIFVQVESHAMVDLEDKNAANLFRDGYSEHDHGRPQGWSSNDTKIGSSDTMV